MTQKVVYPQGTDEFAVTSGQNVAIMVRGENRATVWRKLTYTNYPDSWDYVGEVKNEERVFNFASDATVQIRAGADKAWYQIGSTSAVQFVTPTMADAHVYMEDFDTFTAADWTITTVEAGAGSATEALGDADGGVLVITNDNADDDSDFFNKVGESFLMESGKKLWFEARFKVSDATQSDVVFGLQITDTTPLDVSDGVFFLKPDGDTAFTLEVEKNNTATSTAVGDLADDTYVTLGFYYDGSTGVHAYVNRVLVDTSVVTNLPDDEVLTISFGIQNGEAAAKVMTVDYIMVAKER